jgi:NADPH:quinone reductase-like Zn-dependent oxidoreductase
MPTDRIRPLIALGALLCSLVQVEAAAAAPAAQPTTARKVVLEKQGSGYRWKLIATAVPSVGAHQVLVRVRAVALNRGDLETLDPNFHSRRDLSGLQVASDAAGDVIAVGNAVTFVHPGMRVTSTYFKNWVDGPPTQERLQNALGDSVDGVLGDYIVLEDTSVMPAPDGLTYEEASTLPTAGLTGWSATIGQHLHRGEVVVIQGTGGVSTFALQFAAAAGARVLLTSSADDKLKRAQAIAPIEGINYRTIPQWSKRVFELTHGHGADLVVDVGGKSTLPESVQSLAFLGTISIVGGLTGYDGQIPAEGLLLRVARAQGIFVGSRADFARMNAFITAHHLHPVIDRTFALEDYAAALKYMAAGQFVGKVVLRVQAGGG